MHRPTVAMPPRSSRASRLSNVDPEVMKKAMREAMDRAEASLKVLQSSRAVPEESLNRPHGGIRAL